MNRIPTPEGLSFFLYVVLVAAIWSMTCFATANSDSFISGEHRETTEKQEQKPSFDLTHEERLWLKNHPQIRFAPAPNYPPVEFFDDDNVYRGITADFIKHINDRFSIRFRILQFKNWGEVVTQTKQRNVDMWGAAAKTKERSEYMNFTKPYIRLPAVIIVRKDVSGRLTMPDLKDKQIVVIRNYATQEYIEEKYPSLDLVPVPDIETGLRMVSFGVADSIVATNASAIYYIEKNGFTNLRVAGESGYEWRLCFGIRSDWPELVSIIQKCLDSISEDEKKAIYRRWISLEAPSWKMSRGQIIALLFVLAAVGIIGILIWNIMLQKKVETRTKQLRSTLKERSLILKNAQIGIAYIKNRKVRWINPMLAFQSGMDEKDVIGKSAGVFFLSDADYRRVDEAYIETLGQGAPYETDILLQRGEKDNYWCRLICQSIDSENVHEGSIWLMDDITAQKQLEQYLTKLATIDHLTGACNRRHFIDLGQKEIKRSNRLQSHLSLLMLDIDHFKLLNDNYGHATGDEALKFFVDKVQSILRSHDILGRIGGEEFAVLLANTDRRAGRNVADRIREEIASSSFVSNGKKISFTVSIGIAHEKNGEINLEELLDLADKALYKAKNRGRNRVATAADRS